MPRLNPFRRRRSRSEQALDTLKTVAQVWTSMKVGSAASRAAKGGAKAYGAAKATKVARRPVLVLLAIPAAAAGGALVWRKVSSSPSPSPTSSPSGDDQPTAAESRPLGPVATPQAVSPPSPEPTAPDPPAGASNPPVAPTPEAGASDERTGPPVGPSPTFADETT